MFKKSRINGTASLVRDGYSNKTTKWWDIRNEVFKRDNKVCQVMILGKKCGCPGEDVHHVIPLSRGGTTSKSNLITICRACHNLRHAHQNRRG